MEFYVVDPKDLSYCDWVQRIRQFLKDEQLEFTEQEGELYYKGDDIAAAWSEDSVLFKVNGETGGLVELRDCDEYFYVFADDLDHFDDVEVKDAVGMSCRAGGALYGFTWGNEKSCRFHLGPSSSFNYFYEEEDADYPPILDVDDVWALFFRVLEWVQDNLGRFQDLKNTHVEDPTLDLEVEVTFAHSGSLDGLNEILAEEEGYERTRSGLRARFRDRNLTWLKHFVALLPREVHDYTRACFRAVWSGSEDGKTLEIFHVGVEKRQLRPFVQLPVHRTSKQFIERFRTYFKGHRIDRQEYYL